MDALHLLLNRHSCGRLAEPAPSGEVLDNILKAGLRAPDHGTLTPWQFILFEGEGRERLGTLLAQAARSRGEDEESIKKCQEAPLRAPLLLVVVGGAVGFIPGVPELEIDPEWVLIGVLPPLLFSSAASMPAMRRPAPRWAQARMPAHDNPADRLGRHGCAHRTLAVRRGASAPVCRQNSAYCAVHPAIAPRIRRRAGRSDRPAGQPAADPAPARRRRGCAGALGTAHPRVAH